MPRISRVPLVVLSAAAVLVALGAVLTWTSDAARSDRERAQRLARAGGAEAAAAQAVVGVEGLVVNPSDARVLVDIAVTLEAVRSVRVGAEIGGRIVEVPIEEHQHVEAGEVLVRLDAQLSEAAVAQARANLLRARSTWSLANQQHGRQRSLSDEGISSDAEFDRTSSEASRSDAEVAAAAAALREAETRLEKTRITAPFGGVVSELDLEPGAYLRTGDPVARVSDLSQIEVEVGVDDRQILALSPGDRARLAVDAFPGEWFEGTVVGIARTPDPATRKYPVPVRVDNPDERLLPGMLGHVRFELGEAREVLRIPRRAVYREFEVDYVYVLAETDEPAGSARALRRRVQVEGVPFRPDLLDVREGLAPGERVAVSGVRELRDGLLVRVRQQAEGWMRP
jgi:membrane fusion protein (multidrug efflux system)